MAEDLADSSQNNGEMLELSICQPDHPNQAVFLPDLNISLQDFRTKITESTLVLPERWLFMTRTGSLIPADQEENLQLNIIARAREESVALDVLITPTRFCQMRGNGAQAGNSPLASFATIVGALRDIYVTSIQPNLHELMKPLIIAAIVSAVLAFFLATGLFLSLGALGGLSRSALSPFLRQNLCRDEMDTAAEIPRLYKRIQELESRMSHMRQVEVGTLTCREDNHMYEENQSSAISVPFRKTKFSDTPRVTFALREVSVDDPHSVRLEDVKVNATGFSLRCSYFGKWMHYNIQYTWTAVGN